MCHAHNTTSSTTPGVYTKQAISHLSPHSLICHYRQLKTPRMGGVRLKKRAVYKTKVQHKQNYYGSFIKPSTLQGLRYCISNTSESNCACVNKKAIHVSDLAYPAGMEGNENST